MIDVNDERAGALAEILSNKTCKKILQLLSEAELSESEIAKSLKSPANTINYNIKKLVESGLIEQAHKFWSVKGKKVSTYKVSNKKILISPKPMIKGILPAAIVTGLLTLGVKFFFGDNISNNSSSIVQSANQYSTSGAVGVANTAAMLAQPSIDRAGDLSGAAQTAVIAGTGVGPWAWFLLGAWGALLIFVIAQMWRKQ